MRTQRASCQGRGRADLSKRACVHRIKPLGMTPLPQKSLSYHFTLKKQNIFGFYAQSDRSPARQLSAGRRFRRPAYCALCAVWPYKNQRIQRAFHNLLHYAVKTIFSVALSEEMRMYPHCRKAFSHRRLYGKRYVPCRNIYLPSAGRLRIGDIFTTRQ